MCFFRKKKLEQKQPTLNSSELLSALGGKENIVSLNVNGSRLYVVVNNNNINKEYLLANGVKNIIVMTDKIILLIEKEKITYYYDTIKNEL